MYTPLVYTASTELLHHYSVMHQQQNYHDDHATLILYNYYIFIVTSYMQECYDQSKAIVFTLCDCYNVLTTCASYKTCMP